MWREWNNDPEHAYKLERCLYTFFLNGISVFESLAFCLYFVGGRLSAAEFPHTQKPHKIDLNATAKAFAAAFPQETITTKLADLQQPSRIQKSEHSAKHSRPSRFWNEERTWIFNSPP
jgi:hypothetical protein